MDHLARILLSVSWQVSILILLVWIVSLITRKSSSEFRYWLWIIVLVRLCIPVGLEIPFGIPTADNLLKEPVLSLVQTPFLPEHGIVVPSVPKIPETTAKPVQTLFTSPGKTLSWQFSINHLIAFIWLAGIIVIGLAILWRVTRLGKRLRKCPPILNPDVQLRLAQLKMRMKITQPVGLFYLDLPGITSPAVSGVFHPRIYLPRTMDDSWSSEDLESVLLHELAHIRCYDAMVNWLQIFIQTVYFFHPLVWLANWKIRQLREEVCDDLAIHHYAFKREHYTQGMINVIKNRMREPAFTFLGLGFIERKLSLSERVRRIMNDGYKKYSRLTVTSVLILSVIGLVSISFSSEKSSSAKVSNGKEFSIRKVKEGGDVGFEGAVSPDGRYLSYVDWETGDLAIYEISTGNKRRLTNKGSFDESGEFAYYSRWSPDGKQVVYDWFNKNGYNDLCIVGLDGSKPRILFSDKEVVWTETYGWSPDGKQILACFDRKDGPHQIVLVSTADGSVRVLKTLEQGWLSHMNFSPDGRYIVYDFPQKEDTQEDDIFILSTDGSREIPLVEHPANDEVLGWAPDGENILFASDRRNSTDAWVIQFSDGKVQGTPKLVKSNIGQVYPRGFTQKGSFYYDTYDHTRDIYFAELDPETGKILAPPKKANTRFEGSLSQPEYSPDGKYIAYISKESSALSIQSLETGKMQEFPSKLLRNIAYPRWSPDGRSILVGGQDLKGKSGIWRIDTQSGIFTLMVPAERLLWEHEWSRDGKAIFLVRLSNEQTLSQILLREIESGTEKELYRESFPPHRVDSSHYFDFRLSCSPDGKWLAFLIKGKDQVLRIMPTAGGEYRELYRFKKEDVPQTLRWTHDGKYILFYKKQPPEKKLSWWRIPMEGGEPQKLGLEWDTLIYTSFHPDGRHIVFSDFKIENSGNWVMENFLPK